MFHEYLNQFRGTIADHDVLRPYAEVSGGQQAVDPHAGGIFRDQDLKIGFHLVEHLLRRKIGIDEIAEVQQLRITPVAAVAGGNGVIPLLDGAGKKAFRNIQILNVVDLIPDLAAQPFSLDLLCLQKSDEFDDGFVVFVVAHGFRIRFQEGNVGVGGKMLTEFIDIDGLIVTALVFEL